MIVRAADQRTPTADVVACASNSKFSLVPMCALLSIAYGPLVVVSDDSGCGGGDHADARSLIVPPGDPHALRAALERMRDAPGECRKTAVQAHTGLSQYAGDRVCVDIERLCAEVIRHPGAANGGGMRADVE